MQHTVVEEKSYFLMDLNPGGRAAGAQGSHPPFTWNLRVKPTPARADAEGGEGRALDEPLDHPHVKSAPLYFLLHELIIILSLFKSV